MSKSLATNLFSVALIGTGFISPVYGTHLKSMGFFAFSGAITNWLAIYMLFEKVPFLYGSGVIPSRFGEFKLGIKDLVMGQFFTQENISAFFDSDGDKPTPDIALILGAFDKNILFAKFLVVVGESQFGGMLGMFGGVAALEPLREPFAEKIDEALLEITESEPFQVALKEQIGGGDMAESILHNVEVIVDARLEELTPDLVKEIIQEMIRKHLGWLVVWGGVFGCLIGLGMSFING